MGFGNVVGGIVGTIDFSGLSGELTSETVVFLITAVVFGGASIGMLVLAKESQQNPSESEVSKGMVKDSIEVAQRKDRRSMYTTSTLLNCRWGGWPDPSCDKTIFEVVRSH